MCFEILSGAATSAFPLQDTEKEHLLMYAEVDATVQSQYEKNFHLSSWSSARGQAPSIFNLQIIRPLIVRISES